MMMDKQGGKRGREQEKKREGEEEERKKRGTDEEKSKKLGRSREQNSLTPAKCGNYAASMVELQLSPFYRPTLSGILPEICASLITRTRLSFSLQTTQSNWALHNKPNPARVWKLLPNEVKQQIRNRDMNRLDWQTSPRLSLSSRCPRRLSPAIMRQRNRRLSD